MADGWKKNVEVLKEQAGNAWIAIKNDLRNARTYYQEKRYGKAIHTLLLGPWAETFEHMPRWYFYREILIVLALIFLL
jgi:hypothetical protein